LRDEFLATISHELRTPLTSILGWASVLRARTLAPDRIDAALEAVERIARAQGRIIDDLLDLSRIISGKLRLELRAVDPALPVQAAIDSGRPAAKAKKIQLQVFMNSRGATILGDADRLQQIVWIYCRTQSSSRHPAVG